jgi:hypothetical protein
VKLAGKARTAQSRAKEITLVRTAPVSVCASTTPPVIQCRADANVPQAIADSIVSLVRWCVGVLCKACSGCVCPCWCVLVYLFTHPHHCSEWRVGTPAI